MLLKGILGPGPSSPLLLGCLGTKPLASAVPTTVFSLAASPG